jgi:hypothetical protein
MTAATGDTGYHVVVVSGGGHGVRCRCRLAAERLTRIELALSTWESERSGLPRGRTCVSKCPRVTVGNRQAPGLMTKISG